MYHPMPSVVVTTVYSFRCVCGRCLDIIILYLHSTTTIRISHWHLATQQSLWLAIATKPKVNNDTEYVLIIAHERWLCNLGVLDLHAFIFPSNLRAGTTYRAHLCRM